MQRGNPYHDERGRFTSPYGAYNAEKDSNIENTALLITDNWQASSSEVDPNECVDDWGDRTDSAYDEAMEREFNEKLEEFRGEVSEVYTEYNREMRERISKMDYEELRSYSYSMNASDSDIREKLKAKHPDVEEAADAAAEDFDTDVADYRYRRIVAKTNGKHKLFAMAMDESGGYGLNGYANDYATQKIKASGLEKEYERYRMAAEAYERGDQARGKRASEYANKKAYIQAKMNYYRQLDKIGDYPEVSKKQRQFALIQENNPMEDDYHTGIRDVSDIKTFAEAMGESDSAPDFTAADIQKAKAGGYVTVYSSKPIGIGAFVTPSRMEAKNYAGDGEIYSQTVRIDDVAWIDNIEGQFASDDVPF